MLTISQIIKIVEKNKRLLNPYYKIIELGVMYENKAEHYYIYIPTNCKTAKDNKLEKIKKLFEGTTDIMFVKCKPNFWSIEFPLKEVIG